jgi:hypothetical protein
MSFLPERYVKTYRFQSLKRTSNYRIQRSAGIELDRSIQHRRPRPLMRGVRPLLAIGEEPHSQDIISPQVNTVEHPQQSFVAPKADWYTNASP